MSVFIFCFYRSEVTCLSRLLATLRWVTQALHRCSPRIRPPLTAHAHQASLSQCLGAGLLCWGVSIVAQPLVYAQQSATPYRAPATETMVPSVMPTPEPTSALISPSHWFSVTQGGFTTQFKIKGADPALDLGPLEAMLERHLSLHAAMQHPRFNTDEWQRLIAQTPADIAERLATAGFFYAKTTITDRQPRQVTFIVNLPTQTLVEEVALTIQPPKRRQNVASALPLEAPSIAGLDPETCRQSWSLKPGQAFTQTAWSAAKRQLLNCFLQVAYPNASLTQSQATIDPTTAHAQLQLHIDTGPVVRFGAMQISGLQHYAPDLFTPLNPIIAGSLYQPSQLLQLQTKLMASGKFSQVTVSAPTKTLGPDWMAPILVEVKEADQKNIRIGVGASTNTGARSVLSYTDRNLFGRGLLWDTSLRIEQRLQSLSSNILFLPDRNGYRDSIQNSVVRTDLEGQQTTAIQNGVRRYWGEPSQIEQFVGANLLYEFLDIDGERAEFNKAATVTYGFNIRRLDQPQAPTLGWIVNAQWQAAPIERISDGRFLQSQLRLQTFYPLTPTTQWLSRFELGMINGAQNVPATYLFRAGGDQSVRGYAFQSLGVRQDDAILGGRVMLTASQELVQWLNQDWGVAAFVDAGQAANRWRALRPALGYGLGVRYRSPIGPVGVDVAYGEETQEMRLHFNLGVNF